MIPGLKSLFTRPRAIMRREVTVNAVCRTCGPVGHAEERTRIYIGRSTAPTLHCLTCGVRLRQKDLMNLVK